MKGLTLLNNRKARVTTLVVAGAAAAAATTVGTAGQAHADGGVWDRVAQCESGGNWNTNTGNGFRGGLQFTASTWKAYGGTGSAHNASKSQQIAVAKRVLAGQGPGAWPVCSKRAGLTRANGGSADGGVERASRSADRPAAAPKAERKAVKSERTGATAERKVSSERKAVKKHSVERKAVASQGTTKKFVKRHHVNAAPKAAVSGKTVTVKAGDTLGKIADRYGVDSWRQLWNANSKTVSNPNLIFVGQVLHLPA